MDPHLSAFPLRIIGSIFQGELFTQLAGGHYFLYPTLQNEKQRCDQAFRDLANQLWDHLHSIRVELLQFPELPQALLVKRTEHKQKLGG